MSDAAAVFPSTGMVQEPFRGLCITRLRVAQSPQWAAVMLNDRREGEQARALGWARHCEIVSAT